MLLIQWEWKHFPECACQRFYRLVVWRGVKWTRDVRLEASVAPQPLASRCEMCWGWAGGGCCWGGEQSGGCLSLWLQIGSDGYPLGPFLSKTHSDHITGLRTEGRQREWGQQLRGGDTHTHTHACRVINCNPHVHDCTAQHYDIYQFPSTGGHAVSNCMFFSASSFTPVWL